MDGFDRETRLIIVAATNRPDILIRLYCGREDLIVGFLVTDINSREDILKFMGGIKIRSNMNLREIAERTPGFWSYLANLMNEAAI